MSLVGMAAILIARDRGGAALNRSRWIGPSALWRVGGLCSWGLAQGWDGTGLWPSATQPLLRLTMPGLEVQRATEKLARLGATPFRLRNPPQ